MTYTATAQTQSLHSRGGSSSTWIRMKAPFSACTSPRAGQLSSGLRPTPRNAPIIHCRQSQQQKLASSVLRQCIRVGGGPMLSQRSTTACRQLCAQQSQTPLPVIYCQARCQLQETRHTLCKTVSGRRRVPSAPQYRFQRHSIQRQTKQDQSCATTGAPADQFKKRSEKKYQHHSAPLLVDGGATHRGLR